jgi:rhodanese-related sulfurtransferase
VTITHRSAAAALVGAAALYAIGALATGHSARAEVPPDLSAPPQDLSLDVWKAAAALAEAGGAGAVVDVRPADAFARYHVPGARSMPGASGAEVARATAGAPVVVVYAGKDEIARKVAQDARAATPGRRVHVLADGARAWYLALELPVPLFSDQSPPDGWADALARARGWFASPSAAARDEALAAVQTLAKVQYAPNLLGGGRKPAAASGAKKKISGGCG